MKTLLYLVGTISLTLLASEMFRRDMSIEGWCMVIGAVCTVLIYYFEEN